MPKDALLKELAKIRKDLERVIVIRTGKKVHPPSVHLTLDIDPREAFEIAQICSDIAQDAAIIGGEAREVQGRKGAKRRLVKRVRTALGFLYA